ncbi:MAG TPA: exonuclease domain-containing protein, partial [Candidatus Limnocylindrales bacterium]|nr:exonuclease domain-containing protein [Candidatus Limnocylindrales bacterium]
ISVGAVVVENGCITEESEFYTMVNPGRPISPKSQKITGISDEMLVGQPAIGEVLLDFLEFAGPRILVAHRAPFDIAFMNVKLCEVIGRRVVNPVIDTAILASSVYPFYDDYSLENLAPRCKVDLAGRHHALADARIAASIFIHLLAQLEEKGVTNLPQLAQLFKEANKRSSYPIGY